MTNDKNDAWSSGLEDVTVAGTRLSHVDGEQGKLVIAGVEVEAEAGDFFSVSSRLLALASGGPVRPIDGAVQEARDRYARFYASHVVVDVAEPMAMLRAALSFVDSEDPASMIGAVHGATGAWVRRRGGRFVVGEDSAEATALDRYFCVVSDHGMNASTFAARVVASTGASLSSSIVAGIAALSGPLHGGAPGPVLDLLDAVAARDGDADAVVDDELRAGRRIMGFGHRIYRVRDPRVAVLERVATTLRSPRLEVAKQLEKAATKKLQQKKQERPLPANVELFTAVVLDAVGLPRACFSAVFACARVAGWCAHVVEQRRVGKLIRPRSLLVVD